MNSDKDNFDVHWVILISNEKNRENKSEGILPIVRQVLIELLKSATKNSNFIIRGMVINLSEQHSLVTNWIAELRDIEIQKDRFRFRRNLERIGEVAAYEISKVLPAKAE